MASLTLFWRLESKHLVISNPVGKLIQNFVDRLSNIRSMWMYGDTFLGDEIGHHMFVQMAAVKKEIKKKDWASSLGKLLGIFLYTEWMTAGCGTMRCGTRRSGSRDGSPRILQHGERSWQELIRNLDWWWMEAGQITGTRPTGDTSQTHTETTSETGR